MHGSNLPLLYLSFFTNPKNSFKSVVKTVTPLATEAEFKAAVKRDIQYGFLDSGLEQEVVSYIKKKFIAKGSLPILHVRLCPSTDADSIVLRLMAKDECFSGEVWKKLFWDRGSKKVLILQLFTCDADLPEAAWPAPTVPDKKL